MESMITCNDGLCSLARTKRASAHAVAYAVLVLADSDAPAAAKRRPRGIAARTGGHDGRGTGVDDSPALHVMMDSAQLAGSRPDRRPLPRRQRPTGCDGSGAVR